MVKIKKYDVLRIYAPKSSSLDPSMNCTVDPSYCTSLVPLETWQCLLTPGCALPDPAALLAHYPLPWDALIWYAMDEGGADSEYKIKPNDETPELSLSIWQMGVVGSGGLIIFGYWLNNYSWNITFQDIDAYPSPVYATADASAAIDPNWTLSEGVSARMSLEYALSQGNQLGISGEWTLNNFNDPPPLMSGSWVAGNTDASGWGLYPQGTDSSNITLLGMGLHPHYQQPHPHFVEPPPCSGADAHQCREKFGPTSVRTSSRARKRRTITRVFSASPKTKNQNVSSIPVTRIGPTNRTDSNNYTMFKMWRSATHTECMSRCTNNVCTNWPDGHATDGHH